MAAHHGTGLSTTDFSASGTISLRFDEPIVLGSRTQAENPIHNPNLKPTSNPTNFNPNPTPNPSPNPTL